MAIESVTDKTINRVPARENEPEHEPLNLLSLQGERGGPGDRTKLAQAPQAASEGPILGPGDSSTPARVADALPVPREQSEAYWNGVRELINSTGANPTTVAEQAIRNSRVVGFGETHDVIDNGFRQFGIDNMARFRAAGMTHLGLEMPSNLQPVLDEYMKTGKLRIPDHLKNQDGTPDQSDADKGALNWLRVRMQLDSKYPNEATFADMLKAARDSGIKLVAADRPDLFTAYANINPKNLPEIVAADQRAAMNLLNPTYAAERDRYIAERIGNVLDGRLSALPKGSQPAKVGLWYGHDHLGDGHEPHASAGELLRARLSAHGERYTSIYGQANTSGFPFKPTMLSLAPEVRRPVAIATHASTGEPNVLGRVKEQEFPTIYQHAPLSDWDYVMLFPKRR